MISSTDSSSLLTSVQNCSDALEGQRHQRDKLKFLLNAAKRDKMPTWISYLSEQLASTRVRIQRLCARRSRLQHKLAGAASKVQELGEHGSIVSPAGVVL